MYFTHKYIVVVFRGNGLNNTLFIYFDLIVIAILYRLITIHNLTRGIDNSVIRKIYILKILNCRIFYAITRYVRNNIPNLDPIVDNNIYI